MPVRFRDSLMRGALSLLLALAACGPTAPSEAEAELGTQRADIRIANSLSTDALVLNAISTNPQANAMLSTDSLKALFDPLTGAQYLRVQLRDPDAQKFMEYLVSCALPQGHDIPWYDPLTSTTRWWKGKAGLCPTWETQSPSTACLRRVSGCILARNNALGRRVELSMRGEVASLTGGGFPLEPVTAPAEYDPDTAQKLSSFSACATATQGVSRDCGWRGDAVGRCQPGATVSVGAGGAAACPGPALGASTGTRMVLRVCEGPVGCDENTNRFIDESEGSCSGSDPVVTFECPSNGYFSVMTGPWDSGAAGLTAVVASSAAPVQYGLSEAQVYSVREGAFYGNLFVPKALATKVEVVVHRQGDQVSYEVVGDDAVVPGAIYKQMFSCYDPSWVNGAAYSTHRVCALPASGANCATTVVGPCWGNSETSAGKCASQDGSMVVGDGDFEQCRDINNAVWKEPVTTFLHMPCDPTSTSPGAELCKRVANKRGSK
ncbi:hypothetical protein KRR26_06110 [Corallococcus sp. M34]|uniref:hypothetical protein n=1 Tax=Citreicoccus inhibens TaxID=2849499 RepID=UPI001C22FDBB|nr:hypothetical protein [Citreicoccus inhibens]MBU8895169.1 hypothetical protein [Citreicoccus inhibens]